MAERLKAPVLKTGGPERDPGVQIPLLPRMIDKYDVTKYLNGTMMGFLEGNSDGLARAVIDNFKRQFNMIVPSDAVKVIIDRLENPDRMRWSIHVDHEGQHYESVIVNLKYDIGYEV